MSGKSGVNYTFKDLGNEIKVRDGTIARHVIRWEVILFECGGDQAVFEGRGEGFLSDGKVDKSCNGDNESIKARFKEPGRDDI